MACYTFEKREYQDSILFDGIDPLNATYIIYTEGNHERWANIENQLAQYHPTKTVYILHNKGWRKCSKPGHIDVTHKDLVSCYLEIFRHAAREGFSRNILVLEDDFIFDPLIKDPVVIGHIEDFTRDMGDAMYMLCCVPFLQIPNIGPHRRCFSMGTHSCIYTNALRDRILQAKEQDIIDWDIYNQSTKKYMYYTPLCYQPFTYTENSRHWGEDYGMNWLAKIVLEIYVWLGMGSSDPSFGFYFMYWFSYLFFFLIFIGIVAYYLIGQIRQIGVFQKKRIKIKR